MLSLLCQLAAYLSLLHKARIRFGKAISKNILDLLLFVALNPILRALCIIPDLFNSNFLATIRI